MDVLPTIRKASSMPLKGGTAINLFYRDMPRLPVDIEFSRYSELLQSYYCNSIYNFFIDPKRSNYQDIHVRSLKTPYRVFG